MMIWPSLPEPLELKPMMMIMPTIMARGARVEGWKNCRMEVPEASRSRRRMICPVMVVPTLAPTIMPTDWCREMIPAPTRPEVITMVAVDDWITAVINRPRRNAFTGVLVAFSRAFFSVPEELSLRPSPMMRIP